MKKRQGQKGFTLIELMIVVAVIGVLSAIAVPQYQNYVKKSELGAALATITALKVNVEDSIATNGQFPTVATGDMASKLGASTTILGVLSTETGATSSAGQIIITLGSETQNSSQKLAISRNDTGSWKCVTDIVSSASATFPKGCINGNILP
ncbi:pilin [Aliivibrio finisterrensis]|uniref:Pilin n=1 Tax=Aliivibrio finisterrensis TaxID=511998 RepID=A0A4Q5KHJ4_9GAMM|nr:MULTISPECIES: pilin [Aliivibrio]MDD9175613.1 pilin [Aliivibrio sp. S3TY1]MDD9192813.1 pilin [Aliivibrio sp. S2TY2]RYU45641.1 pilin [Aliivibrio finisterrensis]